MDPEKSFQPHPETGKAELAKGTGGHYSGLRPGKRVHNSATVVASLWPTAWIGPLLLEIAQGTRPLARLPAAGTMLRNLLKVVPELSAFANIELEVAFNMVGKLPSTNKLMKTTLPILMIEGRTLANTSSSS